MCGIVGYIGFRDAYPIVIKGLHRLEYRGYDSAGIALSDGQLKLFKKAGKVSDLEAFTENENIAGTVGMGHTRWATHGAPSDRNSHPHTSGDGKLTIIHNGIIENYAVLKEALLSKGHTFNSDTDTEVLIHLIEEIKDVTGLGLHEAVRLALNRVVGAYAIVIMSADEPDELIAARKGSPMVIGVGKGEYFIASDATPIVEYTKNVIYLNDNEIAYIRRDDLLIKHIDNTIQTPYIHELELKLEMLEKGGYDHFMLKEIYEQPRSIRDCLRGRIYPEQGIVKLGGLKDYIEKLKNIDRIIIVACGTSWHAGLVGEYLIEECARVPVEVEYASEFRYRNPIITSKDLVIAISQSGETADTMAAIELAKEKGATIFGICNVVGASIPRITHAGVYTHAGPEIGVASTKAFTAQVTILTLIAFYIAQQRGTITQSKFVEYLTELDEIPELVERTLKCNDEVIAIAERFKDSANCLFLGRGNSFPVALEGALKLKEISYIHAEGYPAAEMKHGPIALIDADMPVVFIATKNSSYEKVISNIQEVKARGGHVIAIVTEGDTDVKAMADYTIEIPMTNDTFVPLLATIPLQLLSYHIAVMRGCNVDQPRNLAKSVTVE
ncbi:MULTISPECIES: glutamine--fructose-6-phosphate transaminase (isomerizing) [unclassified Mucilaginibacter]|uniref:glutamine--fructose-6-phosphate transaminase (isomerizing) n=1 Tax=unclassified Mucilaginibacter TaxID=2617802 RepID=UPI0009637CA7|nr:MULTISPECIES: glutamine--fructose-6-phosphate transaminase (isomerizing) [unclassified Mucilaginibacter]OJW17649.1 MAG: glutamine--fructose-6-phosphate aminotransferase [Mucilaginibacter sp. 44-25]PLW90210.1 MAG: glutamine--fructose-6-phosphate transaminase (isomerizing) [Mucilaginibacter sp.]PMP64706.1 MAG: glutamine--fructose-6-phosphate transaminase (isomerizing) [Mucilaginibacter sp.]HEK19740.1 glutamine--fructose-6-phosphate transaminase (isomerizing) [Bacteroidota bacterium]